MTGRVLSFPWRPLSTEAGMKAAERVLGTPFDERISKGRSLHLEDPETLRRGVATWIREHWEVIAIAALMLLGASLTKLERIIPAMNQPAPDWVGPLVLALPFTAVAIYFVVRFIKGRSE